MKTHLLHRRTPAAQRRQGFSLAELMVVIVILGLLATVVVPNVWSYFAKANTTVAKTEIASIVQAVDNYRMNNSGQLPQSLDELIAEDANGQKMLDYDETPIDPWNNPYVYEPGHDGNDFNVISYGKDGQPGGEGEAADIDRSSLKRKRRE